MFYARCDTTPTANIDGTLSCPSWTIVSEEELLNALPIQQLFELLNEAFSTPEPQQLAAAFAAAFTLPMVLYLSAWALSKLINFIK